MNFNITSQGKSCRSGSKRLNFLSRCFFLPVIFCVTGVLLTACTVTSQQNMLAGADNSGQITVSKTSEDEATDARGWWQIGFHRQHGTNDEIQWQYDTFLALKVFKPVIDSSRDIELWRFHRRASMDKSGHKFSFIFYATRDVGEQLYQSVASNPVVKQLLDNKHIDRLSFYDINKKLRTDFGSSSDGKWPVELQQSWPYFIMGVSQTWLGLVAYHFEQLKVSEDAQLEDYLEAFKQVNARLNELWKYYGSHAFLHHLNALFAYQELYIIENRLGRF